MEPVLIKIVVGADVVETLINLARHREAGIVILSGSGLVTDVTLHKLASDSLDVIEGLSNMTSLFGFFIDDGDLVPPQTMNIVSPISSFSIVLFDSRGQVFGGKIGGKVKAVGVVLVTATFIKNPTQRFIGWVSSMEGYKKWKRMMQKMLAVLSSMMMVMHHNKCTWIENH